MSHKIYLAGPISHCTFSEANNWRERFAKLVSPDVQVLSPLRTEGMLAEIQGPLSTNMAEYQQNVFTHGKTIVEKDYFDIKNASIVLVNLLNTEKVSVGTVAEMGMAYAADKMIVLVLERDNDKNPHKHAFVEHMASIRVETLEEGAAVVNGLCSTGVGA